MTFQVTHKYDYTTVMYTVTNIIPTMTLHWTSPTCKIILVKVNLRHTTVRQWYRLNKCYFRRLRLSIPTINNVTMHTGYMYCWNVCKNEKFNCYYSMQWNKKGYLLGGKSLLSPQSEQESVYHLHSAKSKHGSICALE